MANLLVELFVEELPPKSLKRLGESFATLLSTSLKTQGLAAADAGVSGYASPRRLAVHVTGVGAKAADRSMLHKLMPVAVALDGSGQPTPALLKKLAALGADVGAVSRLQRRPDGKAEALFLDSVQPGATLAEGLQRALTETLAGLPIPKVMQYPLFAGSGEGFQPGWTSVNFVRPAHGLIALHGASIVPVSVLGLQSGRRTRGHRFESTKVDLDIESADTYAHQLRFEGAVIAGFAERRAEIARQLSVAAAAEGLRPVEDDALLDEVTGLVERPKVLLCRFEAEFLAVPPECLILTMKANQKYFPLLDATGRLTEKFLVVSNIDPPDPTRVIGGNERVVRPRLADAKFFYDQDRKKSLESRVPHLSRVVYHGKLGSQGDRVGRVRAIAAAIGHHLGQTALVADIDRAALLAKADLLSDMVGEFPELQGVMGAYYARHDGETEAVAQAVEDHYKPRFAGDSLARGDVGLAVALADKMETLAGLFGIGQLPTGDRDPFALRRHALGVIRMLIERDVAIDLRELISVAFAQFTAFVPEPAAAAAALSEFIDDRLRGLLREEGYTAYEVDAVVALRPQRLADVPRRMRAVRAFAALPEAPALAAANKRVGNILRKSESGAGSPAHRALDASLLREPAEVALATALRTASTAADAAFEQGDYTASLQAWAVLKAPVDAFFESVMVNAEDPALRLNRMALLGDLHAAMNRVADLSRLAP
jgi:glycyl-tRNA synthetase beta chain